VEGNGVPEMGLPGQLPPTARLRRIKLGPELDLGPLGNGKILEERVIQVLEVRPIQAIMRGSAEAQEIGIFICSRFCSCRIPREPQGSIRSLL